MKRLAIAITILTVGAAGCGGSNSSPNNPSAIHVFNVQLSAQNEAPPITNAESTGRGTAVITINSDTNTVDFSVSLTGLSPTSNVTAAHIHGPNAPAGVNAGVLVSTGLVSGSVGLVNGAGTFNLTQGTASASTIQQILASPQNFYFNVHSSLNGNGVMRGQLQ